MIERHSKVFVPVSVDERLPQRKNKFPEAFLTIIEGYEFNPRKELFYADDQFRSDFGKVTHWLEEKENVYVLTEQELKDVMVNFAQLMIAQYNTENTNISQTPLVDETCELYIQSKTNPQTDNK